MNDLIQIQIMPPTSEAIRRLYENVFYGKQALWHACLWMPIIETMARKDVIIVTEPERLADFELVKIEAVTTLAARLKRSYGVPLIRSCPTAASVFSRVISP
jgi:hypothetical protein